MHKKTPVISRTPKKILTLMTGKKLDELYSKFKKASKKLTVEELAVHPIWGSLACLEVPTGELCDSTIKTYAITTGSLSQRAMGIVRGDRFRAQGLEGKVRIIKPLYRAFIGVILCEKYRVQLRITVNPDE